MYLQRLDEMVVEKLDLEWIQLMQEAKSAGLTTEEVRDFLVKGTYLDVTALRKHSPSLTIPKRMVK